MALWRDPLDELIDDLERALPAKSATSEFDVLPPFEDFQLAVHATLYGTPEDRVRTEQDPRVRAVWAYLERLGRALQNGA